MDASLLRDKHAFGEQAGNLSKLSFSGVGAGYQSGACKL